MDIQNIMITSEIFETQPHTVKYDIIKVKCISKSHNHKGENIIQYMVVKGQCNLINCLDLYIHGIKIDNIKQYISSIETLFGGRRYDIMRTEDIDTEIRTTSQLHGRHITYSNADTIIPLTLSPLHSYNLVEPSTEYHDLEIHIAFSKTPEGTYLYHNLHLISIYGKKYTFENDDNIIKYIHNYAMISHQHQYTGIEKIRKGVNRIVLNFVYPLYCMYFWGCDKNMISKISLVPSPLGVNEFGAKNL